MPQCPGGTYLYNGKQINCNCTDVYAKRFGITYETYGFGQIPTQFNSTIEIDAQQNLVINISFSDNKTDPATNLDNNVSCISPIFNKYGINFAGTPTAHTPIIMSTYNEENGYRTWSYLINQANFYTQLIAGTYSQAQFNYAGYFGIDFTVVGIVQFTYQYTFTIQFNRQTNATTINSFRQFLNIQTAVSHKCESKTQTLLQFCKSSSCETPISTTNLALYQNYWLLLNITDFLYSKYLLKNPIITLLSDELLFRQYTPVATQVNATAGKTIISINVDFAYSNVVIGVTAQIFPPGSRRILVESTNITTMQMTAASDSIDCIKYSSTNQTCVSCADQCKINSGIASPSCPLCDNSTQNSSLPPIALFLMILTY